ncbi:DUF2332 domain-containing protein [Microbacteriaceae bacterium VKM Ac-2855]|nr:DUF2332 domain-containing protein [Microbacteriaceae bacterium VKM Ac-2855]
MQPNPTAAWYLRAADELAGTSAVQVRWARAIADDPACIALIEQLPREHRQPSLVFSVAHYLGADASTDLAAWLPERWRAVAALAATRTTQTNEPNRCAPLVAALALLPDEPIALIEVGASAGLCLIPDAYSYDFGGALLGTGSPLLGCTVTGGSPPPRIPRITWRCGIDLHPLDAGDTDDRRWLRALLPPDRPERVARLDAALETIDPPTIVAGDALAALPGVLAAVPAGLRIVVAALGTLVYLPPADRHALLELARAYGAHTVTLEPESALPELAAARAGLVAPEPTPFLLALDGRPLACVTPHGDRLSWLSRPDAGDATPSGAPSRQPDSRSTG